MLNGAILWVQARANRPNERGEEMVLEMIKQGSRVSSCGESWTNWAVFRLPPSIPDEDLEAVAEETAVSHGFETHYGGPGRSFSHSACFSFSESRLLITEFGGMDV